MLNSTKYNFPTVTEVRRVQIIKINRTNLQVLLQSAQIRRYVTSEVILLQVAQHHIAAVVADPQAARATKYLT